MNFRPPCIRVCLAQKQRRGSTLVDLVAVWAMVGITVALVAIDLQRKRAVARKVTCQNNIRNIGIAMIHYHQVHKHRGICS